MGGGGTVVPEDCLVFHLLTPDEQQRVKQAAEQATAQSASAKPLPDWVFKAVGQ